MAETQADPVDSSDLDRGIENAGDGLADSITHALHDKPSTMLVCVIVSALSAPLHSLWNTV
jgi:hypothetical protein